MKSDGKEKEAERHRARINRRGGFMWKIYAASEAFLLIAATEFCVILWCFYLSFCTGSTKWNTATINILLLFLAGLLIGLWLKNPPLDKKKSETIVFKNMLLLVSLLHLAGLWKKSYYLMDFGAASRPLSLSNYIAFGVFFFRFNVYAVILRTFARFETIYLT